MGDIHVAYGDLLFTLDSIRDELQSGEADNSGHSADMETMEQETIQAAAVRGECAYNRYREIARRIQVHGGGAGSEEHRLTNASARRAIDSFLASLGDCGSNKPHTNGGLQRSTSMGSVTDVFREEEPAAKRIRKSNSVAMLSQAISHVVSAIQTVSCADTAAGIVAEADGLIGGGGLATASVSGRYAAHGIHAPRLFGMLIEYSSLAAGRAVQTAFENGFICVYVMCAGMVRDEHSMAAVKAADCNNAALRGGPSSLIRGEICIYQGDIRANLQSLTGTLEDISKAATSECPTNDGVCIGLITCHAAMHALLSKAYFDIGVRQLLQCLVRPLAAWSIHICEPSMPNLPVMRRGAMVHIVVPGWSSVQLEVFATMLAEDLPGLENALAHISIVPLREMDAIANTTDSTKSAVGTMPAPEGYPVPVENPPPHTSTAQMLVDRFSDTDEVKFHLSRRHTSTSFGDTNVVRLEATLAMELLYHILFDVHDPVNLEAFRDTLSWRLRGDQLTIINSEAVRKDIESLGEKVRVSCSHFAAPPFKQRWSRACPMIFDEAGARVLFDLDGGLHPLAPCVTILASSGFD